MASAATRRDKLVPFVFVLRTHVASSPGLCSSSRTVSRDVFVHCETPSTGSSAAQLGAAEGGWAGVSPCIRGRYRWYWSSSPLKTAKAWRFSSMAFCSTLEKSFKELLCMSAVNTSQPTREKILRSVTLPSPSKGPVLL